MKHLFFSDLSPLLSLNKSRSRSVVFFNLLLIFLLFALFSNFILSRISYNYQFETLFIYRVKFLKGFGMTIALSLVALVLTLIISLINIGFYYSRIYILQYLSRFYVEVIRGTPLIVQVVFFYYIVATGLGLTNSFFVGCLIIAVFSGAYVFEIIRGGIESIAETQLMTANAIGLTHRQTYRLVIFPQVIRRVLPGLAGQMASIIKDTSLLSVVGLSEFYNESFQVSAITFASFEIYLLMGVGYLLLTLPISLLSKKLEKRFYYES